MSNDRSSTTLHHSKDFWNECVTDARTKIAKAKQKIKNLEMAIEIFQKNAKQNVPVPGELAATPLHPDVGRNTVTPK